MNNQSINHQASRKILTWPVFIQFLPWQHCLAWQPPRTNGSIYLCSLISTVLDNIQKHSKERDRQSEARERGEISNKFTQIHYHIQSTIPMHTCTLENYACSTTIKYLKVLFFFYQVLFSTLVDINFDDD